jgi:hypothetical protein
MKGILAVLLVSFLLSGCGAGEHASPEKVLTKFFEAISKKNIEEAKKYVTADSEGMINMMQMSIRNMDAPEGGDQFNPDKLVLGKPAIEGEEAQIPVTEKSTGETVNFFLKKEVGQWKVAFDMATLAKMAQQKVGKGGMHSIDDPAYLEQINKAGEEFKKHLENVTDSLKGITEELFKKSK